MKPTALVCTRLADMHVVHPDQIEGLCHKCNEKVGIYPTGQRALERFPKMKIVCHRCAHMTTRELLKSQPAGSMSEIAQEARDSRPVAKS